MIELWYVCVCVCKYVGDVTGHKDNYLPWWSESKVQRWTFDRWEERGGSKARNKRENE